MLSPIRTDLPWTEYQDRGLRYLRDSFTQVAGEPRLNDEIAIFDCDLEMTLHHVTDITDRHVTLSGAQPWHRTTTRTTANAGASSAASDPADATAPASSRPAPTTAADRPGNDS